MEYLLTKFLYFCNKYVRNINRMILKPSFAGI